MILFAFLVMEGIAIAYFFLTAWAKSELIQSRLQANHLSTEIKFLKSQINPHFLFNTLHAIGTLIHEDPASAEQMLLNLSSLLRVFLEQVSFQQISVRRELRLVDLYLGIQQIRFRDRLTVRSSCRCASVYRARAHLVAGRCRAAAR